MTFGFHKKQYFLAPIEFLGANLTSNRAFILWHTSIKFCSIWCLIVLPPPVNFPGCFINMHESVHFSFKVLQWCSIIFFYAMNPRNSKAPCLNEVRMISLSQLMVQCNTDEAASPRGVILCPYSIFYEMFTFRILFYFLCRDAGKRPHLNDIRNENKFMFSELIFLCQAFFRTFWFSQFFHISSSLGENYIHW